MPPTNKRRANGSDPREQAVRELVEAHKKLDEPLDGAIWLSPEKDKGIVWLLEVIPSLSPDARAHVPLEFIPTKEFRYGLRLFTGRLQDLIEAIDRNQELAAAVANGKPIPKANPVTNRLQKRALRRRSQ